MGGAPALLAALLLGAAVLAGCSAADDSELPWVARGETCVRESEEGPVRRVINRVDPELCGRETKHRPQVYVRVLPPPGTRSR